MEIHYIFKSQRWILINSIQYIVINFQKNIRFSKIFFLQAIRENKKSIKMKLIFINKLQIVIQI
jgi:hypothetical protein